MGSKFTEILFERTSKIRYPQILYSLVSWPWCFMWHTGYAAHRLPYEQSARNGFNAESLLLFQHRILASFRMSFLPAQLSWILFWWTGLLELWLLLTNLRSFLPTLVAWSKKKKLEKCTPSLRTHHWFIRESEIFCWSWIALPTCWKGHLSDCSSQVQRKGICSFSWGRPHSTSACLTNIQKLPPEEIGAETDVRTEGGALGEAGSGNNRKRGSSVSTHSFPKWFGSQHSALSKIFIPGMLSLAAGHLHWQMSARKAYLWFR